MTEKPATPKRPAAQKAAPVATKPVAKPATAKTAAGTAPAKPATRSAAAKPAASNKPKKVRDSFSMPQDDYDRIAGLKKACLKIGIVAKKSELLRAGLQQLGKLKPTELKQALEAVQNNK